MEGILVPLGLFAMVVLVIYFVGSRRHQERMELIKQGINPTRLQVTAPGNGSLLWGLLLVAVGLALVIQYAFVEQDHDTMGFGLAALFGGAALLAYYKVTAPQRERALKLHEQHLVEISQPLRPKSENKGETA